MTTDGLLGGRYRLLRELGRGSSGRVLLAADTAAVDAADAPRAVKLVEAQGAGRLLWELELLRGLSHPNLLRVFELLAVPSAIAELDVPAGALALVTEVAPGEPLGAVARGLRRDEAGLLALCAQVGDAVARALGALHARGLAHGDVKPENVIVQRDAEGKLGSCKLVDFGLARAFGHGGELSGSPAYMAPEAFRGERGPSVDLYALGVTLRELLSGTPDDAATRALGEHAALALRPPAQRPRLPAFVPPPLAALLDALIEPEPAVRPGSVRELRARLAAVADALGVSLAAGAGAEALTGEPTALERAAALSSLPLIGHGAALDSLLAAIERGGLCVVAGPLGSGRSRLVREAVAKLQAARALSARAVPSYQRMPRLPSGALGADCIVHVEAAGAIDAAEARACVRAAELEGHTLALVLELPVQARAQAQAHAAWPTVVELGPLPESELRRLIEQALPGTRVPAALLREAMAVSSGLSGRLCELLAELLRRELDPTRAQSLRALGSEAASELPPIPASARALVELLAIAGGELPPQAAQQRLGQAVAAEAAAVSCASGLSSLRGAQLVLRRDLVGPLRATLSASRSSELAQGLPASLLTGAARAHVLAARGERIAARDAFVEHVRRLRAEGDPEQAASCARDALAALAPLAPLASDTAQDTEPLLLELADALRALGRYADALDALAASPRAETTAARAELHRLAGQGQDAAAAAQAVIADSAAPADARAAAETVLARLAFDADDASRAEQHADAAEGLGGAPTILARVAELRALLALQRGDTERATASLREALERARRAQLAAAEARLLSLQGQTARAVGDGRAAIERFAAAVERADAAGEQHAAAAFLHNLGIQQLDAGDVGPATVALRQAAQRLVRLGREADVGRALYNLGYAAQLVGADDVATSAAERAVAAAEASGDRATRLYSEALLAEQRLRAGDRRGAAAALVVVGSFDGLASEVVAVATARRVSLFLALGDRERAAQMLALAEQAAASGAPDDARIEALLARTIFELEQGRAEPARLAAEQAHALAERTGSFDARLRCALTAARTARACGQHALQLGRLSEARALLDHVAQGLPSSERARLRAVEAYRTALEALPPAVEPLASTDDRARTLVPFAKRLLSESRLPRLHALVLDLALELASAEAGYLVLRDREGGSRVRERRGQLPPGEQDAVSRSIVARVIGTGAPLTTIDAASDDRLSGAASVHALALRSVLAVPLRVQGEVLGVLYLEDRLRPFAFGAAELALLSDFADFAALALDSARRLRLEHQAARRTAVLRARLARKLEASTTELGELKRKEEEAQPAAHGIVAHSPIMQRALELALRVARSDVPVLVCGESGTGKELVARAIHAASPRAEAAFVSENCGAIPEPLLESALFGHVRGAFTGADRRRLGLFEVADGGTLFLDEIGEMSLSMQARLLRVLQDGEVRPLGSDRSSRVDVRVVTATHRDLPAMVADGRFREDLFYRLAVVRVDLPPLRDRPEDLAPLVQHFLRKHAAGRAVELDRLAMARLVRHDWPGNVRQLENEMRRALVLADERIDVEHLSAAITADAPLPTSEPLDLRAHVDALERRLIRQALDASRGNQTHAARMLGVSRFGLQKMMRRLNA